MVRQYLLACAATCLACAQVACGGHEARTLKMRTALDVGDTRGAIAALDEELEVKSEKDLPADLKKDDAAILVLDRGSIQQSAAKFDLSKRDFEAADKAIDMLDLARNAGDSIGEYVFSGSSGKYVAPPYEKLLINTLDMLNYLETGDLNGARIEARRLAVMQRYYKEQLKAADNPVLGLGATLAGFAFEKSGETDEALRWYDDALRFGPFSSVREAVKRMAPSSNVRSPRIKALLDESGEVPSEAGTGEVLFVVGFGRVPHKVAQRVPIGLALTYVSGSISPNNAATANKLAAQGLVTWVNFPTLAPSQGRYETPVVKLGDGYVQLEEALDVEQQVRTEWKSIESKIIVSAITRMVTRLAVGQGIQTVAGRDNIIGILGSLAVQGTLTALDTPDTRSWETLPARVAVARVRVPVGQYAVDVSARGTRRTQEIVVREGGWSVVSLMALR